MHRICGGRGKVFNTISFIHEIRYTTERQRCNGVCMHVLSACVMPAPFLASSVAVQVTRQRRLYRHLFDSVTQLRPQELISDMVPRAFRGVYPAYLCLALRGIRTKPPNAHLVPLSSPSPPWMPILGGHTRGIIQQRC